MDWTRSDVISALALLISLGTLTVVWRNYLRNVRAERTIFWAQDHGIVEGGSWHYVKIRVRNRAPYAIRCEQIEIMRPQRAVIVRWGDAMLRKDAGTPEVQPDLTPAACTGSASMRLIAAHAGQEQYNSSNQWFPQTSDSGDETFLVHCPRSKVWARLFRRPSRLSMRISWRSDESSRRQITEVHTELRPAN
jgi:hypothetical protein